MKYLQDNRKTYDLLASEYEKKAAKRQNHNAQLVKYFIPFITSGKKVLDVGCAVGLDVSAFAAEGFEPTGIDFSEKMVRFAQARNPQNKIVQGDFLTYAFHEKFDAIFTLAFIHLFSKKDIDAVFKRMFDLLNDNGVVFITTTKSTVSKEGFYAKEDYDGAPKRFRKFWTSEELKVTLEKNNFRILDYIEVTDAFGKKWFGFTASKPKIPSP